MSIIKQILNFPYTIVGVFCSVIIPLVYKVNNVYKLEENILLATLELLIFICWFLVFLLFEISKYKKTIETNTLNDSLYCLNCIKQKVSDVFPFENYGLLTFEELSKLESKLQKGDEVVVYTYDLASEDDASKVVIENRSNDVKYTILYYINSKPNKYNDYKKLYGEENLVDLSKKYQDGADKQLAEFLGLDIIFFRENNGDINTRGYFAVDFNLRSTDNNKKFPREECIQCRQCNYVNGTEPFYKEISSELAKQFFDEGVNLKNAGTR